MSIAYDAAARVFTLATSQSTYQFRLGPLGHLLHLYYGPRAEDCFDYLYPLRDCGYSPNPYALRMERGWSLDTLPQEYSGADTGDYRVNSLHLVTASGVWGADLRYLRHEIRPGKYALEGLPAAFAREGDGCETLSVTLGDSASGIEAELLYAVFPRQDLITRAVRLRNTGRETLRLEKAASLCLDLPFGRWDLLHFHGRHTMERQPERLPVARGIHSVSSTRGASSHHHNPYVILCDHTATEDAGSCYGVMPLWSGSHRTEVELDQAGSVRVVSGIQSEQFSYVLEPGASFTAPEVLLCFSAEGLGGLSRRYHRFLRERVCKSPFAARPRPVLLNNWEATYFDFNAEKLLRIAREAKALGVDLFVLDDGWFGARDDDNRALGDWFANERKLPGGLGPLIEGVRALGLQFGLWLEPEMVSEDSDLYRAHPDWALTAPGREPVMGRNQLVLDLSRQEVTDWLYDTLSGLLRRYPISYIKWDCNRNLTDAYSHALPPERQGEVYYRYMLGLYGLLERLTAEFPAVLFEGCAGGGGRFDAGMLAYFPQIWCSDNTDPIERLMIHYGTSFGYPLSAVGAHVSAAPNHQTGRSAPLGIRALAALSGGFGYELDPEKLTEAEKAEIRAQLALLRRYEALIREGDYYRLSPPEDADGLCAWEFVSPDRREALVCAVATHVRGNPPPAHLYLRGLDRAARYVLDYSALPGTVALPGPETGAAGPAGQSLCLSGAALCCGGYTLPRLFGDWPGALLHFTKKEGEG